MKMKFFLANCTSELHPMDLYVIRSFKVLFQKPLVWKILVNREGNSQKKGVNFLNILEAMSFVRQAWNSVEETSCHGFVPNIPSEASAYEDSDEETVIYNNYTMDNDDQIPGWEDVPSNGSFTEYVSCDVELSTCNSEQKKNEDSKSSADDEETEIELKKVTFEEAVCSLNILNNFFFVSRN